MLRQRGKNDKFIDSKKVQLMQRRQQQWQQQTIQLIALYTDVGTIY